MADFFFFFSLIQTIFACFLECKTEQEKKKKRKPGILTPAVPGATCPSTTVLHRPRIKINWQVRKTRNSNAGCRKESYQPVQR